MAIIEQILGIRRLRPPWRFPTLALCLAAAPVTSCWYGRYRIKPGLEGGGAGAAAAAGVDADDGGGQGGTRPAETSNSGQANRGGSEGAAGRDGGPRASGGASSQGGNSGEPPGSVSGGQGGRAGAGGADPDGGGAGQGGAPWTPGAAGSASGNDHGGALEGTAGEAQGATGGAGTPGGSSGSAGAAGAPGEGGSSNGGEAGTSSTCSGDLGPGEDSCVVTDEYGLFVSPSGSDLNGTGEASRPFATISGALIRARQTRQSVYLCATQGAYDEALRFDDTHDGLRIYGGFDCTDGAWMYDSTLRAEVRSPHSLGTTIDGTNGLILENLSLTAADGVPCGDSSECDPSSIALRAVNATNVSLHRVRLAAGNGAPGANGSDGEAGENGEPTTIDRSGQFAICLDELGEGEELPDELPGGSWEVSSGCGSRGGRGGTGLPSDSVAQAGGLGLPDYSETDLGDGGAGETEDVDAQRGENGAPGPSGFPALSAEAIGSFAATGYLPADGQNGNDGLPGQGGGGGGAARGNTDCVGASGGAGAQGGCGGFRGAAGEGGGASVALYSWNSGLVLIDAVLVASHGGSGGRGGNSGRGGRPGYGAAGGGGQVVGLRDGADGGDGGPGGDGSAGSGGSGGPSIAVVFYGSVPILTRPNLILGDGGPGGLGGSLEGRDDLFPAENGADGESYEIYEVEADSPADPDVATE